MNNMRRTISVVHDLKELIPSSDILYGIKSFNDMSTREINLYHKARNNKFNYDVEYEIFGTLATCQRLRHKISVLNRRLQRTRTENKRLRMENQRLIDFYKKYE